jgi:hypothetical protein
MYVAEISSISRVALHHLIYVMSDSPRRVTRHGRITAMNLHSISRFVFYSRVSFPVAEAKQRLHRAFLHSRPIQRLSSRYHTLEISTLWAEKSTFKILKRGFQGLAKTTSSRYMALVELGNQSCLIYVIFC